MKRALVLLALLALPTAPLAAQVTLDFTPRLGAYVPLKDLIVGTDPTTGLPLTQRAQTKFTIGGRLGVWLAPSFGFEGVVDYNKSGVGQVLGGIPQADIASHLFASSGRAMVRLGSGSSVAFILSAGGGLVSRGGDFAARCNRSMCDLEPVLPTAEQQEKVDEAIWHAGETDELILRGLVESHFRHTGSLRARMLLDQWAAMRGRFVKVFQHEYKRALKQLAAAQEAPAQRMAA